MPDHEIGAFTHGTHNLLNDEIIPPDAASDESNWYTQDGRLKLIPGRLRVGTEGAAGSIQGQIFGYKVDGTKVHWRKTSAGKIQYYDGTAWQDTVTGLSLTADYFFSNYSSLAGTFTFAFGADGIYKMHNANPASYVSLYDSSKNFKGFAFIDKGRTILWNRNEDKTGLYGSKIDPQNSTVYTTVTNETIGTGDGSTLVFSGTLAFKGGGATRNAFGITVAVTGGETFTDNYLGVLTGSAGATGTINYITGAWTLTFTVAPANSANNIKATYQWENSNSGGVTDFTKAAPRVAGEGFQFPQDEGGDAIQRVLVGLDGAYYSLKKQSAYRLVIDPTDLATGPSTSNEVFRRDMGVPSLRAAVSMQKGIVFINTANEEKPELTLLQKNPVGGEVEPLILFPQFKFANYNYADATIETWERYVLVFCRSANAPTTNNDTILLCDLAANTVDITNYSGRTATTDQSNLYIGSSITQTVYQLYTGTDDDGLSINNYWISKGEMLVPNIKPSIRRPIPKGLKKHRLLIFKGNIEPNQQVQVYTAYDSSGFALAGTIVGSGTYVDSTGSEAVGESEVGETQVGADVNTDIFPYMVQIKVKSPRFRKRYVKLVAIGIGYFDIEFMADKRIVVFPDKIPKQYRMKANVSLDGLSSDLPTPHY